MNSEQEYPQPRRGGRWSTRWGGLLLFVVSLALLSALFSYSIREMGWSFLNPLDAAQAAARPCTNTLGLVGLYLSGLLYAFLGAAAVYLMFLLMVVGADMALNPAAQRTGQWVALLLMLISACALLSIQPWRLTEWAAKQALRSPGGYLGYLDGTCVTEALLGRSWGLTFLLLLHAIALIYFARLTPGAVYAGMARDLSALLAHWRTWRQNCRKSSQSNQQEWKLPLSPPEQRPPSQPELLTLPPSTPTRAAAPSAMPAAPALSREEQAPPPSLPPRRQTSLPRSAPAVAAPPNGPTTRVASVAPQASVAPTVTTRTATPPSRSVQPTEEAEEDCLPPPLAKQLEAARMREARREDVQPPPTARTRNAAPLRASRSNLLDLMRPVEEAIERSNTPGLGWEDAPPPVSIKPGFQEKVLRHMGLRAETPPSASAAAAPSPRKAAVASRRTEAAGSSTLPTPSSAPASATSPSLPPSPAPSAEEESDYPLPPYDLLAYHPIPREVTEAAREEMVEMQQRIIDTLDTFKIAVTAGAITRGPSITRYEFYPPRGLRVNRISNLNNDLMLATQSKSVNILAPIPGKNTVGIELENATKSPVYLRELLQSEAFHNPKLRIPVALGKDVYGNAVIGDLAAMPHTLVAGTTGSGKSVCINSMILSMLYKFRPDELRLVLVDPKVVEMQPYRKLPHLACPVVTNPARVIGALRWAVNEMEHRYSLFSKIGVRNFEDFNNRPEDYVPEEEDEETPEEEDAPIDYAAIEAMASEIERQAEEEIPLAEEEQDEFDFEEGERIPAKLPYIVIIIDELADLMMVVKEDLENYIARLTQKARAAGIHLVVATQTPRSNVVTGIIKANIPSRIALKVSSPLDSRIILDMGGAENLLGKGDFLFLPPGGITKLTRAQGAFVSDAEIASIIRFCASHAKQHFEQKVTAEMNNSDSSSSGGDNGGRISGRGTSEEDDELYTRCVSLVVTERKASTSLLQRRFSIGYSRAAKIMDLMEERGVISPPQGPTKAREVLVEEPD